MTTTLHRLDLKTSALQSRGILFLPERRIEGLCAAFTHGYTSHKGALLAWATKLSEFGIPTIMFDLPGHYLGDFSDVAQFDDFKTEAHELFAIGVQEIQTRVEVKSVVLGGHSLGGMLALKALALPQFRSMKRLGVTVGLGCGPAEGAHVFQNELFRHSMMINEGLVSPALRLVNMLPWMNGERERIAIRGERIHMITGEDDLIVRDGQERLADILRAHGNEVTLERPKRLPHHMPELASHGIFSAIQAWSKIL